MNYKVIPTTIFEKELKKLAKKYPSIKEDIFLLVEQLKVNPTKGISLVNNCYKIRLAIKSKGKGKSAGGRVITHVRVLNESVHLLSIYDKSAKANISVADINNRIKDI